MNNKKNALYRHYNSNGELLYVGISLSSVDRLARHVRHSSWAYDISRIDITWMSSRRAALLAERNAIHDESPKYNKFHNSDNKSDNDTPIGWVDANRFYDDSGSLVFILKESMVDGLGYFSRCKVKWDRPPTSKTGLFFASVISSRNWDNKKCSIEIPELRKILKVEGKYNDFGNMKRKLITPAVAEIESCSNIEIRYEEIKEVKRVKELRFDFSRNTGKKAE